MDILDLLGVHQYDIEVTKKRIIVALEEIHCYTDDLAKLTAENLTGQAITEDLGNQVIEAMLEAAKDIAVEHASMEYGYDLEVETYCNGADSRFTIAQRDIDILKATHDNEYIDAETIIWLYDNFNFQDFKEITGNSEFHQLLSILDHLSEEERESLSWEDPKECELTNSEIEEKEREMYEEEHSKVFFMAPISGQIWSMEKEDV